MMFRKRFIPWIIILGLWILILISQPTGTEAIIAFIFVGLITLMKLMGAWNKENY